MAENNFVYPRDVAAFGFDWGRLALTVAPEVNGAQRFSGGVVDLPPGQGHARHNHPGAEEIIFVISGEGEQMVDNGNPFPVREGDAVYIPANTLHSTYNTTWRPLRLVVVYTPGGAEIGLDALPDARILEPGNAPRWTPAS